MLEATALSAANNIVRLANQALFKILPVLRSVICATLVLLRSGRAVMLSIIFVTHVVLGPSSLERGSQGGGRQPRAQKEYRVHIRIFSCTRCPPGRVQPLSGAVDCLPCSAGTAVVSTSTREEDSASFRLKKAPLAAELVLLALSVSTRLPCACRAQATQSSQTKASPVAFRALLRARPTTKPPAASAMSGT